MDDLTAFDADEIYPNLWQGSIPPPEDDLLAQDFEVLVLCAKELQFVDHSRYPFIKVIRCPIDDSLQLSPIEKNRVVVTAKQVAAHMKADRKVLVTCAEGRNRSGLVVGCALLLATGWIPSQVVRLIQRKRQQALTNPYFVSLLKNADPNFTKQLFAGERE